MSEPSWYKKAKLPVRPTAAPSRGSAAASYERPAASYERPAASYERAAPSYEGTAPAPSWLRQARLKGPVAASSFGSVQPKAKQFSAQLDDRFNEDVAPPRQPAGEVSNIHGAAGSSGAVRSRQAAASSDLAADPSGPAASSGSVAAQMAAAKARLAARGSVARGDAAPSSGSVAASSGSVAAQMAAARARLAARGSAAPSSGSAAASSGSVAAQMAAFRDRRVAPAEDEGDEDDNEDVFAAQRKAPLLGFDEENDEGDGYGALAAGNNAEGDGYGALAAGNNAEGDGYGALAAGNNAESLNGLGVASGIGAVAAASALAPRSKLAAAKARLAGIKGRNQGARAPASKPMTNDEMNAFMAEAEAKIAKEEAAEAEAEARRRANANALRAKTLKNSNALAAMTRKSSGFRGLFGKTEENPVKHTAMNMLAIIIGQRLPEAAAIVAESGHAQHFLTMEQAPYNTRNGFYSNILTTFTSVLNDMKDRTRPSFAMQGAVIQAKQAELAAGIEQCHASYEGILDPKIKAKATPIDADVSKAGTIATAFYTDLLRDMSARNAAAARAAAAAAGQANSEQRVAAARALMVEQGNAIRQHLASPEALAEAARVKAEAISQGVAAARAAYLAQQGREAREAAKLATAALIQTGMPAAQARRQVAAAARPPPVRAPLANPGGPAPANAGAGAPQANAGAGGLAPAGAGGPAPAGAGAPQANAGAGGLAPAGAAAVQPAVGGGRRKAKHSTHRRKHSGGRRTYRRLF
jgi:hypothetical protein